MNDRLQKVFEMLEASNPDICICVTDKIIEKPGPHILYVNKKWQEVTGYSFEDAVGKTPRILQGLYQRIFSCCCPFLVTTHGLTKPIS